MKLIILSLDRTLADRGSAAAAKMAEYAEMTEKYLAVVPGFKDDLIVLSPKASVKVISGNKILYFFKILSYLRNLLRKEKFDLVSSQDPFGSGMVAWILKKIYGIPMHLQEHGDFFSSSYWKKESVGNFLSFYLGIFLLRRADGIRAVSERIRETLISRFGIEGRKVTVVSMHTPMRDVRGKAREIFKDDFLFLSVARFVKQKNLGLMIEAFSKISADFPQTRLLLVGRGPEKERLEAAAKRWGVGEKVVFKDWTEDVDYYYSQADAYLLSSNYEGWGRVIIEAGMFGLPVIMTDVGCAREIVKDGKNGLVVPVGDPASFGAGLSRILSDPGWARNLGENLREDVVRAEDKEKKLNLYKRSWENSLR